MPILRSSLPGARPNANYFLLDGATNTDPTFNTQNLNPNPDMVQEFQLEVGSVPGKTWVAPKRRWSQHWNRVRAIQFISQGAVIMNSLRNGSMDAFSFGAMGMTKHLAADIAIFMFLSSAVFHSEGSTSSSSTTKVFDEQLQIP